nr:MAG TPA: aspartate carbamoyltransferase regulatory subunit [Caudoviricetes sp.]
MVNCYYFNIYSHKQIKRFGAAVFVRFYNRFFGRCFVPGFRLLKISESEIKCHYCAAR